MFEILISLGWFFFSFLYQKDTKKKKKKDLYILIADPSHKLLADSLLLDELMWFSKLPTELMGLHSVPINQGSTWAKPVPLT